MGNIITKINEFKDSENHKLIKFITNNIINKINNKFPNLLKLDEDKDIYNQYSIPFLKRINDDKYLRNLNKYLSNIEREFNDKYINKGYIIYLIGGFSSISISIKHLTGRVIPNRFIYHQTDITNIPSIKKYGIKKSKFGDSKYRANIDLFYPPSIFLSMKKDSLFYDSQRGKILIEVDTTLLDKAHKFYLDHNMYSKLSMGYKFKGFIVTYHDIPPSAIVNIYEPDGKTLLSWDGDDVIYNSRKYRLTE